jgi:hypothetical protein
MPSRLRARRAAAEGNLPDFRFALGSAQRLHAWDTSLGALVLRRFRSEP